MEKQNQNVIIDENGVEIARSKTKFDAYTGDEPYLFVSYSHRDEKVVYSILDKLHDQKYRIWYDESCETGNDFRDELRQRIVKSAAVVLFVSASSMASPFCGMEIIVARENGKRLYPVFLDDATIPPAFEILLNNTHHGSVDDVSKLIRNLKRDLPEEAMDRLTIDEGRLIKCEDNGKSIVVDDGVTVVCQSAFKERRTLVDVALPDSLVEIELEAFRGCGHIKEMYIPAKTVRIGESAFRDCVSMTRLIVTNNCIKIGERAFENCANLTEVTLPDGLTEIYGGVFNSCKSLKEITLPSHLTVLGESAFSDCVGLEKIDVPESVTKIDDLVFNGCTGLTKIELHEGLKKIGKAAFKNCKKLTNVTIPTTVSSISEAPFRGCAELRAVINRALSRADIEAAIAEL